MDDDILERWKHAEVLEDIIELLPMIDIEDDDFKELIVLLVQQYRPYFIIKEDNIYLSMLGILRVAFDEDFKEICKHLGIYIE